MITSNKAEEIIAECNAKALPAIYLEIYVRHLCQKLEFQDERIEWHKEQIKQLYEVTK